MSRRYTRFLLTQTLKPIDNRKSCNEQHIRISRSMLYSEAFMSLNHTAMKLYLVIRLKFHKEEEGNIDFPFSKSLGVKVLHLSSTSEKTIKNALLELVKKGFLDQTFISKGRREKQ